MKAVFFVVFLVSLSTAHDLWAERDGNLYRLYYGHKGKEAKSLDINKVLNAVCLTPSGPQKVKVKQDAKGVYLEGPCKAIGVEYYWGYFSQTPEGIVAGRKDEVIGAIRSWESTAYLKCVYDYTGVERLGQRLEITPLIKPQKGKKLEVDIFYDGKPTSDAFIYVNHRSVGNPDKEGRVRLRVGSGLQVIGASLKLPSDGKKADYKVLESYLCLEVD